MTNTTVEVIQNRTQLTSFNETRTREVCSCQNSRFPSIIMFNPPVRSNECGQDATNSSQYSCCVNKDYVESLYFGRQSCSAALDTADCVCNTSRNATCSCTPLSTQITYRNLILDTSRCQCLTQGNS